MFLVSAEKNQKLPQNTIPSDCRVEGAKKGTKVEVYSNLLDRPVYIAPSTPETILSSLFERQSRNLHSPLLPSPWLFQGYELECVGGTFAKSRVCLHWLCPAISWVYN